MPWKLTETTDIFGVWTLEMCKDGKSETPYEEGNLLSAASDDGILLLELKYSWSYVSNNGKAYLDIVIEELGYPLQNPDAWADG